MFRFTFFAAIALTFALADWGAPSSAHAQANDKAQPLGLDEAVRQALAASDPSVARFAERSAALAERAVSDSQLPDPMARVGVMSLPTDSFSFTQEGMTQLQFGVAQAFPRGRTLSLTRDKREAERRGELAMLEARELEIVLETRSAWLELFYWRQAREKVRASRKAVSDLAEIVSAIFGTGRSTSQDVLRTELELSILDDRLVDVDRQAELARADLARYIGNLEAARPLPAILPILAAPAPREVIEAKLVQHPSVAVEDATIDARERDIDIARQQYKPGWAVEGGYGLRAATGAPDLVSLGVSLDVPLFTAKRQDRNLAAARREKQAARLDRQTRLLEMQQKLERAYADWLRQDERIDLYKKIVVARARHTSDAALAAYRSGVSDFAELIRANLAELDVELTLLRLEVDQTIAQAQLLYLEAEKND
ncbi:MAG: TolC family protein [Pseudomonadota bacterium]